MGTEKHPCFATHPVGQEAPMDAGVWKTNVKTHEVFWSEGVCALFGRTFGETLTSRSFWELVHLDDIACVREVCESVAKSGIQAAVRYRVVLPDGRQRVVSQTVERVLDQAGQVEFLTGTLIDVTDHRR